MDAAQLKVTAGKSRFSRIALAAFLLLPISAHATFGKNGNLDGDSVRDLIPVKPGAFMTIEQIRAPIVPEILLAMGDSNTSKVVGTINRGKNQCASVPAEYQADCLSQTFKSASSTASRMVDYVKPGKDLSTANKKIDAVVSQNLDKNAPVIRKGGKKLRAVKKSAVAKVNAKTKAIISETETKLIRSAGNSALRKTHFSRIAKAVGSTKSILRSA